MITLKLKTHEEKLDCGNLGGKFSKKIVFYLLHKNDYRSFFTTFVLVDLHLGKINFFTSYCRENIDKIEKHPDERQLINGPHNTPHSILTINLNEDFYVFNETANYFYYVNYKKKIMKVILGKDLNCKEANNIVSFGDTLYKDDEDERFFYFSAKTVSKQSSNVIWKINYYKASLDLNSIEKIYDTPSDQEAYCPHTTRKYKQCLLNSEFRTHKLKLVQSGKSFDHFDKLQSYVFSDFYQGCPSYYKPLVELIRYYQGIKTLLYNCREFICWQICGWLHEKRLMNKARLRIFQKRHPIRLPSEKEVYFKYRTGNKDFINCCSSLKKYRFETLPGILNLYDLRDKKSRAYQTRFSSPAHFEIDEEHDMVYVSSHNFGWLDRLYFLGPAAIDKYQIVDGKLIHLGCFTHPTGYRFITHRVFQNKGKTYICALGHPNRLFVIDTATMKSTYYSDLGKDYLSNQRDIRAFINHNNLEDVLVKSVEVSDDGNTFFLIGSKDIYLYGFLDRKILKRIKYIKQVKLFDNISLDEFRLHTAHSQYLQ